MDMLPNDIFTSSLHSGPWEMRTFATEGRVGNPHLPSASYRLKHMNIALIGYGKMGRMIEQEAVKRGHTIVCTIDIDNRQDFDSPAFRSADVAIEFTAPTAAWSNVQRAWEQGVKVVSGTTGWIAQHTEEVALACQQEGKTLLWASNFSVGVAIFRAVNRQLARIMNRFPAYDVSLTETHHVHKLDAPSGTAITLAETVTAELERKQEWIHALHTAPDGTVQQLASAQPDQLAVNSIRRDEVPGIHTITYDSEADSIILTHDAHSRRGFALGAVLAAEYTAEHSGLLSADDLFAF